MSNEELVVNYLEGKTIAKVITQGHLAKFLDEKGDVLFMLANYRHGLFDKDGFCFDWQKVEDVPVYVAPEAAHDTEFDSDPKPVADSPDNHVDTAE